MNLWTLGILAVIALIGQGCANGAEGQKNKSSKDAPFPDEPASPPQSN